MQQAVSSLKHLKTLKNFLWVKIIIFNGLLLAGKFTWYCLIASDHGSATDLKRISTIFIYPTIFVNKVCGHKYFIMTVMFHLQVGVVLSNNVNLLVIKAKTRQEKQAYEQPLTPIKAIKAIHFIQRGVPYFPTNVFLKISF